MIAVCASTLLPQDPPRPRAADLGLSFGDLPRGPLNAITDVAGVRVGHHTLRRGDDVCTGVTVVLPHGDDPFQHKVPAAIEVYNGYGKLTGISQVRELGELESPVALTNTLNVPRVADALLGWLLEQPGNERVRSANVVVGETNDGRLNDIRGRHVDAVHVRAALDAASDGPVAEGTVGAGTGTVCFGYKGGIGTASRRAADFTVGVLVQSNFGGTLTIDGRVVGADAAADDDAAPRGEGAPDTGGDRDGSCVIVVATDAPLAARNLGRLARRAFAGMARTGASFSNGSGDYAIAFSTATALRRTPRAALTGAPVLSNAAMTPLFIAVADATEEAIVNSLLQATSVRTRYGSADALDPAAVGAPPSGPGFRRPGR